jgi:hypothetical protein
MLPLLAAAALFAAAAPVLAESRPSYVCPMHPEVRSEQPGQCPKCGMELMPGEGPAGLEVPMARNPSGTAWQPDATPMRGVHLGAGGWDLMLHGAVSFGYDHQLGNRGGRSAVSTSWFMGMAQHELWGGEAQLRAMLSLEPLTVPGEGYPLLLQSGEFYRGVHLHDRQHPHDFFMEASFTYRRPLSDWLGAELYLAPVGEPALGPPAFMHRASAEGDPFPPISHHWQDSTHVSFGVATAALYTRQGKLEGSWFNGREPDEDRWNFDLRPFDSFSVRLSANPVQPVSLQVSYGYLASPEPPQLPGVVLGVSRVTGSVSVSLPLPRLQLDTTLAWGRNLGVTPLDSFLFEANFDLDGHNAPFVRLEHVEKTAHDLVVPGVPTFQSYALSSAVIGFVHSFRALGPVEPALGGRVSLGWIPADLEPLYGSRALLGGYAYLMLRAPRH